MPEYFRHFGLTVRIASSMRVALRVDLAVRNDVYHEADTNDIAAGL
jgi:hypothetical protein